MLKPPATVLARLRAQPARIAVTVRSRAGTGLASFRAARAATERMPSRGVAFVGTVWAGGDAQPGLGTVVIDGYGRITELWLHPAGEGPRLPSDLLVLGGPRHWVVPGVCDAHVHLGFDPGLGDDQNPKKVSGLNTGLIGVRDLGAPLGVARNLQTRHSQPAPGEPFVAAAGPILTAVDGYPSRSWGAGGYAEFVSSPAQARIVVRNLATEGVDLIKLAFEAGDGQWPVLDRQIARAIVDAAHTAGLPAVAHALKPESVSRALDVGVDELVHTPTTRLSPELVDRIATAGVSVTSTLQTFFSDGVGRDAAANAADLVAAGVRLRYGTDLGNAGTRVGVDPRELDRLADTGLGRLGALRAATEYSATAPGMRSRTGLLTTGEPAALVLLPANPLDEPGVWRTPAAVFSDARLTVVGAVARHD